MALGFEDSLLMNLKYKSGKRGKKKKNKQPKGSVTKTNQEKSVRWPGSSSSS